MALLIDGYNLLHASDIFAADGPGTELHRARLALLEFLARAISPRVRKETSIVFDAGGAPPGLPSLLRHEQMTVHFARNHADADEMIEELLEQAAAPRALVVVSGDHRVQRAARHVGATPIDSAEWYLQMKAELRTRVKSEAAAKPQAGPSPEEVQHWVDEFGDAPHATDAENTFPPGYADDLNE